MLSFGKFILLLLLVPLLRGKLKDLPCGAKWIPVVRTSGAYAIGFAGSDSPAAI